MAVETVTASLYDQAVPQNGIGGSVKHLPATLEVSAAASVSSRYILARIPSGAILSPAGKLYWDDMATSGSPTLDVGLEGPSFTYDDDILNDGLALSAVGTGAAFVKDIANYYKPLWQIAGLTEDPYEIWTVKGVIRDAAVVAGGTLTSDLLYVTP